MIVDDSATMRSLVMSYLTEIGEFDVAEAASGFDALKLLPTRSIDLILTDINMPNINGLELISFVRNNPLYRSIPIVVITTEKGDEDRRRGLTLGANDYIVKPFTAADLRDALERAKLA
jgi:two-component system chemotaxis response regulator CheY